MYMYPYLLPGPVPGPVLVDVVVQEAVLVKYRKERQGHLSVAGGAADGSGDVVTFEEQIRSHNHRSRRLRLVG